MTDLEAAVGDARLEVSRPARPVRAFAPTSAELEDLLQALTC